jgi:riboflavin transporter 2
VFTQLPILTHDLPEGWAIASYLAVILQAANLIALVYALVAARFRVRDRLAVWVVLFIALVSSIMMSLFWSHTAILDSHDHSLALFILFLGAGFASCLSQVRIDFLGSGCFLIPFLAHSRFVMQVSYWPFVGEFRPVYSSGMAAGESASGLITAVLAAVQDPGPTARFSLPIFMLVLACIVACAMIAAALLMLLPAARVQLLDHAPFKAATEPLLTGAGDESALTDMEQTEESRLSVGEAPPVADTLSVPVTSTAPVELPSAPPRVWPLFVVVAWAGLWQNGVLYSVLPYACLSYPDGTTALRWAVIVSQALGPLASMLAGRLPRIPFAALSLAATVPCVFILTVATRPLAGRVAGAWLVVFAQACAGALLSFLRSGVFVTVHRELAASRWQRRRQGHMRLAGLAIQAGSAVGALVLFLLVNYTHAF